MVHHFLDRGDEVISISLNCHDASALAAVVVSFGVVHLQNVSKVVSHEKEEESLSPIEMAVSSYWPSAADHHDSAVVRLLQTSGYSKWNILLASRLTVN